jgi:hypothetical protein
LQPPSIPLLLWGAVVWAFNAGPEEVASKTAAWAKFLGYPDFPAYIVATFTNLYVLIGASVIALQYLLAIWIWPLWRTNIRD